MRNGNAKIVLAHGLRTHQVIEAVQLFLSGFQQQISQVQHHQRAKNHIGETFDRLARGQMVDKKLGQAAGTGHAPAVKVDAGNQRLRVGV